VRTGEGISVFSTAPQSSAVAREDYVRAVTQAARWSERQGCAGMLIYTDNRLVDPWLVAAAVVQATESLLPLVAVQPVYMHPYTVARMVSSLGHMYGRRIFLNMVAGGFKNDLTAFGDPTPHDLRYERLREYTLIIKRLLSGENVTFAGQFYNVQSLKLTPALDPSLFPGIFISGSSAAGLAAARELQATAIKYPGKPGDEMADAADGIDVGVRVGIIARAVGDRAWQIAHQRFPPDRKGQLTHQLAMKVSDSQWHKQISELASNGGNGERSPYWTVPFENYRTFCPYLVGSYEDVGREVSRYVSAGFHTFILDIPPDEDELHHSRIVFDRLAAGLLT
jgi:alkanesulfonate monooxygenase